MKQVAPEHLLGFTLSVACMNLEGGGGGGGGGGGHRSDPSPLKNHRNIGFLSNTGRNPLGLNEIYVWFLLHTIKI